MPSGQCGAETEGAVRLVLRLSVPARRQVQVPWPVWDPGTFMSARKNLNAKMYLLPSGNTAFVKG